MEKKLLTSYVGKNVLIRSEQSGVHFGELAEEEYTPAGKAVIIKNTQRIWSWAGAATLSEIALRGVQSPGECKFSVVLDEMEIVGVVETIPLTEEAHKNLRAVKIWQIGK